MLWEYKELAALINVSLFVYVFLLLQRKTLLGSRRGKYFFVSLGALFAFFTYSFLLDTSQHTIYIKIMGSLFMCIYGSMYLGKMQDLLDLLSKISIAHIIFFFLYTFVSVGYQEWGDINTYIGFYYFKTDMALATVISASFVLNSPIVRQRDKILLAGLASYIVLLTNARIHLLTLFCIVSFSFLKRKLFKKNFTKNLLVATFCLAASFFLLNNLFQNELESLGLMTFKTDEEALSTSNLQGRDDIWGALYEGWLASSSTKKIFGAGLAADTRYTSEYMRKGSILEDAGVNAHSSYFYLLISIGFAGTVAFAFFLLLAARQFLTSVARISKISNPSSQEILTLVLMHLILFFVSSLSNVTLIFQQQTWFFMFFIGYLFNKQMDSRKLAYA
jgi:hypothetical protein